MNEIARIYQDRFGQTGLERRDQLWKVLCRYYFDRRIPANATVLDLACGYGEFINNITAAHKLAVDLNPDAARHLKPGVVFSHAQATDLSS